MYIMLNYVSGWNFLYLCLMWLLTKKDTFPEKKECFSFNSLAYSFIVPTQDHSILYRQKKILPTR